jgi:hypothetical protein
VNAILRRIAEIERLIEQATAAEPCARPAHELTDAECVDAYRRLAKLQIPKPPPFSPQEEAAIVAAWRKLVG